MDCIHWLPYTQSCDAGEEYCEQNLGPYDDVRNECPEFEEYVPKWCVYDEYGACLQCLPHCREHGPTAGPLYCPKFVKYEQYDFSDEERHSDVSPGI